MMRETDELLPTTAARIVDPPRARPRALALTLAVALCAASAIAGVAISPIARHFIAGVLAHARGLEALAAPTPGCYSRHGNWAPTRADWGHDDRNVCIRVKSRDCAPGDAYV